MTQIDASRVAARVTYDASGRSFTIQNARAIDIEVDTSPWAPIGGTSVCLFAEDDARSVQMAFGFDAFLQIVEEAVTKFARLDIEFAKGETSPEQLEARNAFLKTAVEGHPAMLAEASRAFRRLSEEISEADTRIVSLRGRLK